ncbi:hypothetical protein BHE74_00038354 [Ensete ventricosum]|nr:hypothetical protein BHE74_00038354 [Ensete ventricosum]
MEMPLWGHPTLHLVVEKEDRAQEALIMPNINIEIETKVKVLSEIREHCGPDLEHCSVVKGKDETYTSKWMDGWMGHISRSFGESSVDLKRRFPGLLMRAHSSVPPVPSPDSRDRTKVARNQKSCGPRELPCGW